LTLRTPEGYPHREVVSQTLDAFRDDSRPSRGRWPPRAGLHSGRRRGRPNVLSLYNIGRGRLSMGSVLEYRCPACAFASGKLTVGWGKGGRAAYWGGLALCPACHEVCVVDLADVRPDQRDHRCERCKGPLKLLEGTSERVHCPQCATPLKQVALGSWA
jgi:hypothetical protein